MATDIVSLVIDALVVDITAECMTGVPEDDLSRAGLVRAGRLQSDPTDPINSITLHPNYPPSRESWPHVHVEENKPMGNNASVIGSPMIGGAAEIGGSQFWWRRGSAQLRCFFTNLNLTRAQAREYANLFRRRVEDAIYQAPTALTVGDSFGERVVGLIRPTESYLVEGGGPPNSWIWQGWIKWEVLTCDEA
jgi:hypothetical protein